MKTLISTALAFLAAIAAMPALAQNAEEFFGSICEIDTTPLNVPYTTPDGTKSVFTFESRKLCTGAASARNIKLECRAPLPGWNRGNRSVKNFECTINGDQCGVEPKSNDPNAPYLTATQSNLKVQDGVATLTCFFKP
jgi:hypothetical protein